MKITHRFTLSLASLMLISGVALVSPVSARDTVSGSQSSTEHSVVEAGATTSDNSTTGTQTETEVENHARDLMEQFKAKATASLDAKKTELKTHTQEERKAACEARKSNLTERMGNAVTRAKNHKEVFDKIYTRVKTFHDTKNLNVADYDALITKADTAQANAAASISALETLDVNVDCSSQTVASSVSAFQQAVKDTRDSLKAYRQSIVELITAVKGASTSTDNSATDNTARQ